LTPRVIDVRAGFAHCQIVVADSVTLVDAGDPRPILAALAAAGIGPRDVHRIVLTHGDGDHTRGASALRELTGAEVAAHVDERGYLDGTDVPPFSLPKRLLIRVAGRHAMRPIVDRWLRDREVVDGLEVIHTPGHTPGHISLRVGDTLLVGDAFSTGERFREVPRLMTADLPRSRRSIQLLAGLDIDRAFSGHAPPADGAGEKLRALAAAVEAN
jgi:glyoxylase-like metal-dependent hydrolase (beta-lactamase superfamily II)